jgi:hypothetical protein
MFQTKVVEVIKTHILCSETVFRKSCRLWDNLEKYCRAGQATVDGMAHAHCILDNQSYKHTLRICNTYRFSTANTGCTKGPQCYSKRTRPILPLCAVRYIFVTFGINAVRYLHFMPRYNILTESVKIYLNFMERTT